MTFLFCSVYLQFPNVALIHFSPAMKQYNGVPLDGRAMSIQLATSELAPLVSPRRPSPMQGVRRRGGDSGRSRGSSGRIEKKRPAPAGAKRGGGGKRGGRGGRGGKKEPSKSAAELDQELDTYLKAR